MSRLRYKLDWLEEETAEGFVASLQELVDDGYEVVQVGVTHYSDADGCREWMHWALVRCCASPSSWR